MSPQLPSFPFVVLDTETTGLLPRTDHVLELAIVRYEQGEKVAEYESLFSVKKEIPPHVQVLTRVRSSDLSGKPTVTDEKKEFEKLLEGAVIVGHNILFDINMLAGEGIELDERPWIDTSMLASLVFPELQSYSLGYLSAALDLPHEPKHRAMGDVQATTALLSKVWERLQELPEDLAKKVLEIAEKGPEGYATLFAALEAKEGKGEWIKTPQPAFHGSDHPSFLTFGSEEGKTWFTVKNLHATVQSVDKKALKNLTIAHAPQFLLEPKNAKDFLEQDIFTADELTLALKLLLFTPRTQQDLPIHGAERAVWKGKLACARDSETYKKQLEDAKGDILLDHRQLLELLANKEGPIEGDHVVIVEASMLEDTATKAFRWSCSIDPLRAAAEGDEGLTSFLDAYQIWVEKVRNFQDVRYFVPADLTTPNAKGLRERLEGILSGDLTDQVRERLSDLENILDPVNLKGRIAYISQFRDGGQMVQSVPEDVAGLLKKVLYDRFHTKLLLPPGEEDSFRAILPVNTEVEVLVDTIGVELPLLFADEHMTLDRLLHHIDGKAIGLIGSKRLIETFFVKYTEELEQKGITLIAQGFAGGLGRMQAEFLSSDGPVVWLLTPWMYEGVSLPQNTVDHLWIHTLPFDHPSHAVLSRRAERFRNVFEDYFVPRLLHRLFRLLRKFATHRKEDGNIIILDRRIRTKEYGGRVKEYLELLIN